jgi:hypothetical protein
MMKSPVEIVQEQLEAYNARDLDRFAATYASDIRIYRMPATEPSIVGHSKLREVYAKRFSSTGLHATIVNRIAVGDKVIDHERVVGIEAGPIEAVAVYQVADGLIRNVWFFYPADKPFALPKGQ